MNGGLRWLLVGAGDIARKRVAPALAGSDGSRLIAVCDTDTGNAKTLATEYDAPEVYDDFEEALARTDAEAVYLATPVRLHAKHACRVLESGRHALSEKPLGLSVSDAAKVVEAERSSSGIAGVAYTRRFAPRHRHLKELLGRGKLGTVVLVRMTYYSWFAPKPGEAKHWRVVPSESGGGPLSDMGSHMFDLLIDLFGMPVRVYGQCHNTVHEWEVEDSAALTMTLANGAPVVAAFGWNSPNWRHEMEVTGTDARVTWLPYDGPEVEITRGRDRDVRYLPDAKNVHLPLIEDFVDAVRNGRPPECTAEQAVETNRLLDAVYRSNDTGAPVEIRDDTI